MSNLRKRIKIASETFIPLVFAHSSGFANSLYQPGIGSLPEMEERMNILAVGVLLLGGLIFLLNRVRQKADRHSEGLVK